MKKIDDFLNKIRDNREQKRAKRQQEQKFSEDNERLVSHGLRFPWCALLFLVVGMASEVVDAVFMNATLESLSADLDPLQAILISAIVGAGCFMSMAFVGFQQTNQKYYTRLGERMAYLFWIGAGVALVLAKIMAGLVRGGLAEAMSGHMKMAELLATEEFIANLVIAMVQMVLYVGTGFMTRDSVRILTDHNLREYFMVRRQYEQILDELAILEGEIVEDLDKLEAYQEYAKRLVYSKQSGQQQVRQYNEAARALVEARMAMIVEPELMDGIYREAMAREN